MRRRLMARPKLQKPGRRGQRINVPLLVDVSVGYTISSILNTNLNTIIIPRANEQWLAGDPLQ